MNKYIVYLLFFYSFNYIPDREVYFPDVFFSYIGFRMTDLKFEVYRNIFITGVKLKVDL